MNKMKMWEIREGDSHKSDYRDDYRGSYRYGRKSSKEEEAYYEGYECGFEEGYAKAMKEVFYSHGDKDSYSERRMSR